MGMDELAGSPGDSSPALTPRVLLVHPYESIGGPHNAVFRAVRLLRQEGLFEFVAVTPGRGEVSRQFEEIGVEVVHSAHLHVMMRNWNPLTLAGYLRSIVVGARELQTLVRSCTIDLVHSTTASCWVGGIAARLSRKPSVYHVHDLTLATPFALEVVAGLVLRLTGDRIVCVSHAAREALPRLVAPAAVVVRNGVDTKEYRPDRASAFETRRRLGLHGDGPLVATVGPIDPRKGHEVFLRAAAVVSLHQPNCRFLVVGTPISTKRGMEYQRSLRHLVEELGLSPRVTFLGGFSRIPELMRTIDLLVQPSVLDAGPLAPLEAMASGTPVIATDVGGNCEEVRNGQTGILVAAGDADALAKAVLALLRDGGARLRMSREGRQWVEGAFDLRLQASALGSLWLQLIHERARAGGTQLC
jgi:glycosyltransferase involved in cell wall biosynthesis